VAPATAAAAATGGTAKLSLLHAVPKTPVDVFVDGKLTLKNFQPGSIAGPLALPAGTYSVAITAAGSTKPLIGPASVNVAEGANTIVYAWGSAKQGDLAFAVQTYRGLNSGPNGIDTGDAGLAAENPAFPAGWTVAAVLALVLLIAGAGTTALVRARR
jgi:hypothetical protein